MADPNPRELAAQLRERVRREWNEVSSALLHSEANEVAAALEKGADAIDALEDMTWQHAYRTDDGMKLLTGGLSSNEYAFDVLGWDDPHDITAELAALGSNLP